MPDLRSAIESGHYARKQIFSRDRLVSWSHGRRFEMAVSIAEEFKGIPEKEARAIQDKRVANDPILGPFLEKVREQQARRYRKAV